MLTFVPASIECVSNLGTFKTGSQVELYQSCPTCTFVNVTSIKLTDGTIQQINQFMTKNGSDYFFTFNDTSEVGEYFYTTVGDKNTVLLSETICFNINPTGDVDDNLWTNFIIIFILTFMSFTGVAVFGGGKNENSMFYYLAAFMLFIIGIFTNFQGFGGYQNVLTQAYAIIIWGCGLFFLTFPWLNGKEWQF